MIDEYFGVKQLYEVVLRAKVPMQFGKRYLQADQPVLYFQNINFATLSEKSSPIMARGGWSNLPHVIWEDRSQVNFQLSEGVMSSVSMGILLSASVTENRPGQTILIHKRQGPYQLVENNLLYLQHWPVSHEQKKTFIYEYERDVAQKKVYGKRITDKVDPYDETIERPCLQIYEDKALETLADPNKEYIVDYYYQYLDEAIFYTVQKERFNGLFTLEGKFYVKDENDGINYTNLIYMPKVRVVSSIDLRLGERANPSVATFNIIGMPQNTAYDRKGLILQITRLNKDIDENL